MVHISPQTVQAYPLRVLVLSVSRPGQKDTSLLLSYPPRLLQGLLLTAASPLAWAGQRSRLSQTLTVTALLAVSLPLLLILPETWSPRELEGLFDASDTPHTLSSLGGENFWNFTELLLQHSFPEAIDAAKPRCLNHWLILQKIILPQCLFPSL